MRRLNGLAEGTPLVSEKQTAASAAVTCEALSVLSHLATPGHPVTRTALRFSLACRSFYQHHPNRVFIFGQCSRIANNG
jgi:hypothetical protein